jgi:hypothetical protein
MAIQMGVNCKLYYLSTGTRASWGSLSAGTGITSGTAPSNLSEITNVKDVTLSIDNSLADISTRKSRFKVSKAAQVECSLEFDMPFDPSDTATVAIAKAHRLGGTIAVVAFFSGDKSTATSQGVWADWAVESGGFDQPLDKDETIKVKLVPGESSVAPEWVEVA